MLVLLLSQVVDITQARNLHSVLPVPHENRQADERDDRKDEEVGPQLDLETEEVDDLDGVEVDYFEIEKHRENDRADQHELDWFCKHCL